MKHIASVSWGKDSLAMLLKLLARKEPLDEVVFYDTGMEFSAIYDVRDQTLPLLERHGIEYTELHPQYPMEWDMFKRPVMGKNGIQHFGYSWCGGRCRWGTTAKLRALDQYCGDNIVYVGIAHDETERLQKERAANKRFPLAVWGMTEGECLMLCYQRGYTWMEYCDLWPDGKPLYALLDRVSCWCCANKNLKELRNMLRYLPEYWARLKELQSQTERPMKGTGAGVFDLEKRFLEEQQP